MKGKAGVTKPPRLQTHDYTHTCTLNLANVGLSQTRLNSLFFHHYVFTLLLQANKLGLVSQDHVWILPSYSTPFWWELSDTDLQMMPEKERCSNDEMDSLLESTIFFHAVKLPAFDSADYIVCLFCLPLFASLMINACRTECPCRILPSLINKLW